MHLAAAVAEGVVAAVALAEVAAASHVPQVAAACRGHLAVQCRVRPPDRGHQSAVPRRSIVPAVELRARQVRRLDQVRVQEAGHALQFSPEHDRTLVQDQEWQVVPVSDPGHRHCHRLVREPALVPGLELDPDRLLCHPLVREPALDPGLVLETGHRPCHPLVLVPDWQPVLESERE